MSELIIPEPDFAPPLQQLAQQTPVAIAIHPQATTATLPDFLEGDDTDPAARGITNTIAGKTANFYLSDSGIASFEFYGILANIIAFTSAGIVSIPILKSGVSLIRVHRHPYANDRHIESGTVSFTGTSGVSFTDAFASAPNIALASNGNYQSWATSVGTTGFTLNQATGSPQNVSWIAEGPD